MFGSPQSHGIQQEHWVYMESDCDILYQLGECMSLS